jgi:hypothetical protein
MRRLTVGLVVCAWWLGTGLSAEPGQRTPGRTIPYSVGRALPDRAGEWVRAAQIQMFNPGDLWEYIDGAAEQFLTYGFQDLATTKYTSDQTRTVVVAEVYRMEDARGAFGIYRQEVSPKARPVALGLEGRASSNTIRFWLAEFYVKLTLPPGGGRQRELEALGAAIAKGLGAPGTMPDEVRWFPAAGQIPDSVKYIPADALGQASFRHAFEAKYEGPGDGSTAVIVPFESDAAAAAALTRYETFLARAKGRAKVAAPGDGGFSATDSFQGLILAVRAGSRLVLSLGAADDRAAGSIVAEIIKRLPATPGGQPRKEGGS